MKFSPVHIRSSAARAFTLIEMMITVGLLGFIVLGLTSMFVHTQKAFRAGVTQTDVLEAGRATMDLVTRELEGITPSRISGVTNFYSRYEANSFNYLIGQNVFGYPRTNVLSCFFGLTENNRQWTGIGYVVALPSDFINQVGVGTLYRFQYSANLSSADGHMNLTNFGAQFRTAAEIAIRDFSWNAGYQGTNLNLSTNLSRVCDGVIDFRVQAYDLDGVLLSPDSVQSSGNQIKNILVANAPIARAPSGDFFPVGDPLYTNGLQGIYEYTFTNNAVPAYLDLQLGVMEPQTYERFKSIPNVSAQQSFLQNQGAAAIHIFRRRIPIHNVDPEAYP